MVLCADPNIDVFNVLYGGALVRSGLQAVPVAGGSSGSSGPDGAEAATVVSMEMYEQDTSAAARGDLLQRLPPHLLQKVMTHSGTAQAPPATTTP